METLFRFNVVHDASRAQDETDPIDLGARTGFQRSAAAIPAGPGRPAALKSLAKRHLESGPLLASFADDAQLRALENASVAIDGLLDAGAPSRAAIATALEAALGEKPEDFLADPGLAGKTDQVGDAILAIKLSPEHHDHPIRRLATIVRAYHLTRRFVADESFPRDVAELTESHRRTLRLPAAILPTRPPSPSRAPLPSIKDELSGLAERYEKLDRAITELRGVRPAGFSTTVQRKSPEKLPPKSVRPLALFQEELQVRHITLQAMLKASAGAVAGDVGKVATAAPFLRSEALAPDGAGVSLSKGARIALLGRPDFTPQLPGLLGMRLSQKTQGSLSEATQAVLTENGLSPSEPVARSINLLTAARRSVYERAQDLARPVTQTTYRQFGSTTVAITANPVPEVHAMTPTRLFVFLGGLLFDRTGVPTSHADIKPSGIMDLLVVKQQLKGYEATDVSHIANVLKGEKTDRVYRKRLETETLTFTETERTVATEQSLETTDRFEMRRESETALQEETAVKGSLMIKGSYGPTVEFQASGEASWQRKSQESEKAANEVAREVTQKASEKVTERVLRRETLRVNRQVEEIDQHTFDNVEGPGHISGVYQWVTKVYEAQVFNYGPRTVYDIMIPEPGAFLLESFRRRRTAALELDKPPAFDVPPDALSEDNYQRYVTLYGATDVKPPPEPFLTESYDFNTGGEDKDQEFTNSTRIAVPDGYQAIRATVGSVAAVWDDWCVDVVIGQQSHRFQRGTGWVWATALDEETGAVPMAMVTDRVGDVAIAVEVICESTERALDLWRADTHAKLVNAYRARLSDYEAKLAELQAEAPAEIKSGPAQRNRALMIEEVKRAAISILTLQHFDMFDAIDDHSSGVPRIAFSEAASEGAYARFFEQSFEWDQLSWVAYPYFWGRKGGWLDKIGIEDGDAEFEAFLKAGFLRVQIPVRPGFVDAVDHFRLFGEPWLGGSLPAISDDTYLPIAEELAEKLGRPGDEVPVGTPWELRVPTTLIKLRGDDQLPRWEQQPDGSWAEA